ncbi:MAG: putative RND superfamily exporter protein [Arenicella sp.]|jgi:predicted RND superfamily exporter protein
MTAPLKPTKLVDRFDDAFETIAHWSIRWRSLVAIFTLVVLGVGLYFANTVRVDNSLDSFFHKQDPAYIAYQEYLEDFVSDEVVYLMYSAKEKDHGPFNIEVMRVIAKLTTVLEAEVPFAREVTSLANVEFMRPIGEDDIEIDELLVNFPDTQEQLLKAKQAVMSKPMYTNYLVDIDADYASIILQMTRSGTSTLADITFDKAKPPNADNLYPNVSDLKVREILARPEFSEQGIEFFISGDVAMNSTYNDIVLEDMSYITLGALLLIALLCFILFRATWAGVLGPMAVVMTSITLTAGLLGFLNWGMTSFFSLMPTLICSVGIAQSVHILLEYQRQLEISSSRDQAIQAALHKVGGPCLMAALTTAAGFAVMSVSDLRMLAEFGIYSAFGVLATFLFSTTLLVIFLGGKPSQKHSSKPAKMAVRPIISSFIDRIIRFDLAYPRLIMGFFGAVILFSFIGMKDLRNDFSFIKDFKPHVEWRQHTEKIQGEMGGMLRMTYLVDTGIENGIKDPQLLKRIEKVQRFAETQPLVKKTMSLADIMKDLNLSFHANNPEYAQIPDQQDLLAQYFLVYQMSGGSELEEFVNHDFSRTVIELQISMTYGTQVSALLDEIDGFIAQNPFPSARVRKTGIGLLWVKLTDYVSTTQIQSYSLVFIMIAILMCISFGSFKVGMISMIPNLTPVVIALGALGWLNIPLDVMKLLLATIAIGIAVDDTIHLTTRFRKRFYQMGNYQDALKLGLVDVGPALIITSLILSCAFTTYLLSSTNMLASFGILLGGTIIVALAADLILMPVLLLKLKPFGPEFVPQQST